jgi:hypothetical protein
VSGAILAWERVMNKIKELIAAIVLGNIHFIYNMACKSRLTREFRTPTFFKNGVSTMFETACLEAQVAKESH